MCFFQCIKGTAYFHGGGGHTLMLEPIKCMLFGLIQCSEEVKFMQIFFDVKLS